MHNKGDITGKPLLQNQTDRGEYRELLLSINSGATTPTVLGQENLNWNWWILEPDCRQAWELKTPGIPVIRDPQQYCKIYLQEPDQIPIANIKEYLHTSSRGKGQRNFFEICQSMPFLLLLFAWVFWPHYVAWGISVPQLGTEPGPQP